MTITPEGFDDSAKDDAHTVFKIKINDITMDIKDYFDEF